MFRFYWLRVKRIASPSIPIWSCSCSSSIDKKKRKNWIEVSCESLWKCIKAVLFRRDCRRIFALCHVTWCPSQYASFGPGMYVIFPADELIYMTYGAALPRIKPRPTLDNLREPQVPFAYSTTTTSSTLPSSNPSNHQQYTRQSSQSNYSLQNSDAYSVTDGDPPRPPSRRSSTNRNNHHKTDIFGYTSTSAANSREPSVAPTINDSAVTSPSPTHAKLSADKKGKPPGKSKNRLHLSLGRLGRSKKEPPPEPARLRELTEIRISNPTFTRENLSARNYDAFFESGEPVYSLEYRTPVTTPITSIESDTLDAAYEDESVGRPSSLGIFNRSAKPTVTFRSRSSDPMNRIAQKGDRCLLKKLLNLFLVSVFNSYRICPLWGAYASALLSTKTH